MASLEEPQFPVDRRRAANAGLQGMRERIHQGLRSWQVNDAARLDGRWTHTLPKRQWGMALGCNNIFISEGALQY